MRELTRNTGSSRAAAGHTDQHSRGQVTSLCIFSSGTQLTLRSRRRLLVRSTCCVGVAVLDGGGRSGSRSSHKTDSRRCVVVAADDTCQADTIEATGACTLQTYV